MQKSLKQAWGEMPAYMELAKRVGADIDAPVRWYDHGSWVDEDHVRDHGFVFASVPKDGLTCVMWEEGDELYKDGVLVWKTESARFYQSIFALVDGKVRHYSTDNQGDRLGDFNEDTGNKCQVCPDHGTELVSSIDRDDLLVISNTFDQD